MSRKRLTGNAFSLLSCMLTIWQYIHQQALHSIPGPTSYTITDGKRFRTVHVNRLQQRIQQDADDPQSDMVANHTNWQPPSVQLHVITEEEIVELHFDAQAQPIERSWYPSRVHRPTEQLQFLVQDELILRGVSVIRYMTLPPPLDLSCCVTNGLLG